MSREETFWNRVIELKKTFKKEKSLTILSLLQRLIKVGSTRSRYLFRCRSKEIILGREYDKGDSDCWF